MSRSCARSTNLVQRPHSLFADAWFMEMFEHGWRFVRAAELLRHRRSGEPDDVPPLAPLDEFVVARERTREMLRLALTQFKGPRQLAETLGRLPATAEIVDHLRRSRVE